MKAKVIEGKRRRGPELENKGGKKGRKKRKANGQMT